MATRKSSKSESGQPTQQPTQPKPMHTGGEPQAAEPHPATEQHGAKKGVKTDSQQRSKRESQQRRNPESKTTHHEIPEKDFVQQRGDRRHHPDVGEQEDVNDEMMEDELTEEEERQDDKGKDVPGS